MRTIPAGEFKAKCLAIMDEVQARRETVVITKRGKPVAKLVPAEKYDLKKDPIFGFMKGKGRVTGDLGSLVDPVMSDEEWGRLGDPD